MNKSIKKVFSNSLFFSIGVVASKAVGFIMLPIYTHYLSDEAYGIATTITGFVATFCVILTLSLRSALMRFYNEYDSEDKRRKFVGSIVCTIALNSIIIVFLCFLFRNVLINLFFSGISFYPLVFLGLLALFFDAIYAIYQSVLQAQQNGKKYTLNSTLYLFVNATFNLLFIIVFKLGEVSIVLSLLCTNLIFSLYSLYQLLTKKMMDICIYKSYIFPALKYSLPILPHDLSNTLSNYLSKIFLNNIISYSVSGLFTVATQITSILNLVQSSINMAFRPWFNEQLEQGVEGKNNIKNFSVFSFSVYGFVSLGIAYYSQELLYIVTAEEYRDSWKVIPFLLMSLIIGFIYYIHVLSIMHSLKMSKFVSICSLSGCVANLIFSLLLIPQFSLIGAGIAKLLSQIVLVIITIILSRHSEKIDFGLKTMIIQILFIVIMMSAGLFFNYTYDISGLNYKNILYKFVLLLFSFLILFWKQRMQIRKMINKLLNKKK